jgi:hypothetical protein
MRRAPRRCYLSAGVAIASTSLVEAGNLLGGIGDPIAADIALIPFAIS